MHFVIQKNISDHDFETFTKSILKQGHTLETFYHIPFDDRYPELPNGNDLFVYAASSVTDKIKTDHDEFKGVFNHTSNINIHDFYKSQPGLMWSKRLFQGTLSEVIKNLDKNSEQIFVRPAIDNKLFSGYVCSKSEFIESAIKMTKSHEIFCSEEIFIGEFDPPNVEFRLFVVDGNIVASSRYRIDGDLSLLEGSPYKANRAALEFYKFHQNILPECCVIDIGMSEDEGKFGVIEVNSINNSGFYAINKDDLVYALSNRK